MTHFKAFSSIKSIIIGTGITVALLILGVSGHHQKEDSLGTKHDCTPTSCLAPQICVPYPNPCIVGSNCPLHYRCECPITPCNLFCIIGTKCVVQPPPGCPQGPQPPTPQCCPVPQCVPIKYRTAP